MNWNKQNPYLAKITSKKLLSGKQSNKEVFHYQICLGDSGIIYQPGDSIGVFPLNDENLVRAIINRLQLTTTYTQEVYVTNIYELIEKNFEILKISIMITFQISLENKHAKKEKIKKI